MARRKNLQASTLTEVPRNGATTDEPSVAHHQITVLPPRRSGHDHIIAAVLAKIAMRLLENENSVEDAVTEAVDKA